VSSGWNDPLGALMWHWGSAYIIGCHGAGLWIAQRRDTRETLRAETPLGLRDKIIADYTTRPVPRDLPGRLRGEPGPGSELHR
jgi:hypothetical protein